MEKAYLIYFSATHTTKKVVKKIAEGTGIKDITEIDFTLPENRNGNNLDIKEDALVIFGAPVYGGRIQKDAAEYLAKFNGTGQKTVCVAVYGNRDFDDALVEMIDLVTDGGFNPIAAAGFIGQHTFATEQFNIANGRPDADDNAIALAFGKKIMEKINSDDLELPAVRGNRPYKERSQGPKVGSKKTEDCLGCLACKAVCPVGAIDDNADCDADKCIACVACIKVCPNESRVFEAEFLQGARERLSQIPRREPELFV